MLHHFLLSLMNRKGTGPNGRPSSVVIVFAVVAILFGGVLLLLVIDMVRNPRRNEEHAARVELAGVALTLVGWGGIMIWRWIVAYMNDWD